jgi:hypothetical protein
VNFWDYLNIAIYVCGMGMTVLLLYAINPDDEQFNRGMAILLILLWPLGFLYIITNSAYYTLHEMYEEHQAKRNMAEVHRIMAAAQADWRAAQHTRPDITFEEWQKEQKKAEKTW